MYKRVLVIALMLAFGAPGLTRAEEQPAPTAAAPTTEEQDSLSLLRASLRMDKRDFVKAAMNLNDKESEKFWSIYYQYEADLMKLYDRRLQLIKDYAANFHTMTNDKAGKLAKTAFELQKSKTKLIETYYKKISKALSNKVAVRFAQVEHVLNSAVDLRLGASIPLMPKQ